MRSELSVLLPSHTARARCLRARLIRGTRGAGERRAPTIRPRCARRGPARYLVLTWMW